MSPVLDRPLGPPPAAPPVAQLPPPGESPPNGGAKAPKSPGPLFDGMHQVALFLLTVGAVIGFTHKFAYTQGLGVNIELGNESPAQLAVDALESLQEYWLLYGGLVLAAFALLVLIGELERRDRLPVRVGSLRAFALCAFLSAVACVSYDKGSGEARNLATLAFHSGDMSHFQEIVMPPQSASHDTASCFNWKPATAPASISSMTYDFVVAETEDRIHVVQITVSYDAMGNRTGSDVQPGVFLKSLVPCYRRVMPGSPAADPRTAPSQTPSSAMPPTPLPARGAVVLSAGGRG